MTANLSKQEKMERKEEMTSKILWIPIILLLVIVPLIMHVAIVYPDMAVVDLLNKSYIAEPYANYKATAIIILSALMAVLLFLVFDKAKLKLDQTIKLYILGALLFLGVSLIATITSEHNQVAWWGMPDRAEGMVMTLCYIFIMGYTTYSLMKREHIKYLIIAVSILVMLVTIIGICDYCGYSLFQKNSFFRNLMISSEARELGLNGVSNEFESGKVIGTMMHYNYVGSFGAMIVPLFTTLTLFIPGRKKKIFFAFMTVCSMFILFGSTSRAGLIGLAASVVVGVIIFAKQILKKWKIITPVVAIFMIILVIFNMVTGGKIFSRIPTLVTDITALFTGSDESFDYKDHIPVRDIVHEDNKEKIVFQTGTLYIENHNGSPIFKDEMNNQVDYQIDSEEKFITTDERFSLATFGYVEVTGGKEDEKVPTLLELSVNNMPVFYFMLDDEKGVVMVDTYPIEEEEIIYPESFGFKGKEKLGSARGYIWSRSIPMMKDTFLIGNGPDTFALEFPQQDYLGKWWAYDTPNMIVDKAHNLYMSIWINNGGLALLGFLIMLGTYIVQSFRLYALKGIYDNRDVVGISIMLAIVGYLGAGIFNDSVVPVAPIFWILLGAGMAINFLIHKEQVTLEKPLSEVVQINK